MIAKNIFIISLTLCAILWILAMMLISMDERARGIEPGDEDPGWEPDAPTGICIYGGFFSGVVAFVTGVTLLF